MTATVIDGAAIAEQIRGEVAAEVNERIQAGKPVPGLATVLVGENPASHVYVRSKHKACQEAGIVSFGHELPENAKLGEVVDLVKKLNDDPAVHGILVQLPLPSGLDEEKVLSTVQARKRCGWLSSGQYRKAGAERAGSALCTRHSFRGDVFAPKICTKPGGDERGCAGAIEHCGHACGSASPAGKRHYYPLPFKIQKPEGDHPIGGYPRCGGGKNGDSAWGLG